MSSGSNFWPLAINFPRCASRYQEAVPEAGRLAACRPDGMLINRQQPIIRIPFAFTRKSTQCRTRANGSRGNETKSPRSMPWVAMRNELEGLDLTVRYFTRTRVGR